MFFFLFLKFSAYVKLYAYLYKKFIFKKNSLIFIYDFKVTPISIGDTFINLILIRLFSLSGNKIKIYLIVDELRNDVIERYSKTHIKNFLYVQLPKLINFLVPNCEYKYVSWKKFYKLKKKKKDIILFKKFVLKRKPIYKLSHNIANLLFPYLKSELKEKFYLRANYKKNKLSKFIPKKYISFGVRYNYPNEKERNLTIDQINKIIHRLRRKYKNHKIILICDLNSYKILSKRIANKNLLYSKSITKNFLEDGFLILNSNFYYQYSGSGISSFAEHSKIPFEIVFDNFQLRNNLRSNFLFYKKNKKNSWQQKNQRYFDIYDYRIII